MDSDVSTKNVYMTDIELSLNDEHINDFQYISKLLVRTKLDILKKFSEAVDISFDDLVDKYMFKEQECNIHPDILKEYGYKETQQTSIETEKKPMVPLKNTNEVLILDSKTKDSLSNNNDLKTETENIKKTTSKIIKKKPILKLRPVEKKD